MNARIFVTILVGIGSSLLCDGISILAQGSKADYERALTIEQRTEPLFFPRIVKPHWATNQSAFWYEVTVGRNVREWWRVDADKGTRQQLFRSDRLANALARTIGRNVQTNALALEGVDFDWAIDRVRFRSHGRGWIYSDADGNLAEDKNPELSSAKPLPPAGNLRTHRTGDRTTLTFINHRREIGEIYWIDTEGHPKSYGTVAAGGEKTLSTYAGHVWRVKGAGGTVWGNFEAGSTFERAVLEEEAASTLEPPPAPTNGLRGHPSPDGQWALEIVNNNVRLWKMGVDTAETLTTDGTTDDTYTDSVEWAPDSRHAAFLRVCRAQTHEVYWVESSPSDRLEPKLHHQDYLKPGDRVAVPRPYLLDVESRRIVGVATNLCANPYELGELRWAPDSSRFTFEYNQRGHQIYRVLAVNADTASVSTVIEEASPTFIDYSGKHYLHWNVQDGTALWMSERDGWNHLWRYETTTGKVLNQVTRGAWVVRQVLEVDPEAQQILFYAGGVRAGEDPYYQHLCRVQLDGTGFVQLTQGDGTHEVEFSPDHRYFLDRWSRTDQAPITELRRTADGTLVVELERANSQELEAAGWTVPERLVAKGRDGKTDIFGILIKPSNFSPEKRYPVVEEVYAGPQDAYVPKAFGRETRLHAMAELGFIVVQIDGMGTSGRSKAFHDICWKNLADAGFPDRIAWIQSVAATRPWMDLSRVGIYGGSAGGQNAMRALIDHADFYRVAVADCGCHDNRMDKIWWNEQWMGWPIGPEYEACSNAVQAHRMQGKLLLMVGELDTNVDPASTMQVVNALEKADRDFELVVITGGGHGSAETPYGSRRRSDFLVRNLWGREPRWE